jgi:hypothetical protein
MAIKHVSKRIHALGRFSRVAFGIPRRWTRIAVLIVEDMTMRKMFRKWCNNSSSMLNKPEETTHLITPYARFTMVKHSNTQTMNAKKWRFSRGESGFVMSIIM